MILTTYSNKHIYDKQTFQKFFEVRLIFKGGINMSLFGPFFNIT